MKGEEGSNWGNRMVSEPKLEDRQGLHNSQRCDVKVSLIGCVNEPLPTYSCFLNSAALTKGMQCSVSFSGFKITRRKTSVTKQHNLNISYFFVCPIIKQVCFCSYVAIKKYPKCKIPKALKILEWE